MKITLTTIATLFTATAAMAGDMPMADASSDSTGGLILLAMIAVVVATGGGMFATRNDNSLDITSEDADDNAGF